MATQLELELKLAEVNRKLKIICDSYLKLKEEAKAKDEQIDCLRKELHRMMETKQSKENNQISQIRKKYEMEPTFRPKQKSSLKLSDSSDGSKLLKYSKSMNSQHFSKYMANNTEVEALDSSQIKLTNPPRYRRPFLSKPSENTINLSFPSAVELDKSRGPSAQINEIDRNYGRQNRQAKQQEAEALILKQLWSERDKEIKRMDDLFQNINKKIGGV